MQEPLSISRFIAVVTEHSLNKEVIGAWFRCVRGHTKGLTLNIPSTDDRGMPRTVCLVHREQDGEHRYIIPLTRDLSSEEAERIVDTFVDLYPDLDFDVQATAIFAPEPSYSLPVIDVEQEKYVALCTAWAKRQHDQWMQERQDNGWRYGTAFSLRDKTNPLLRPWDQLPDRFKAPNLEEPQALLDLLNDQGYTVITKSELEAMLSLMRQPTPNEASAEPPKKPKGR